MKKRIIGWISWYVIRYIRCMIIRKYVCRKKDQKDDEQLETMKQRLEQERIFSAASLFDKFGNTKLLPKRN